MKGKKKLAILAPLVVALASAFAGCSQLEKDAVKDFNQEALNLLNNSPVVSEVVEADTSFDKFDFLGADFSETASSDYDVDISGIAKYNSNKKAFVKMSYTFDGENFSSINEKKQSDILKVLSSLIGKEEMKSFEFMPISSVKSLNGVVKSISESPLDEYDFNKGLVFSLSDVKFDQEGGNISFRIKTYSEFVNETTVLTPIPILGPDGVTTIIPTPITNRNYADYIQENNVIISVSNEEMAEMLEDKSLIFDKFVELVSSEAKDQFAISQVSSEKPTKFDTTTIDKIDEIEEEFER